MTNVVLYREYNTEKFYKKSFLHFSTAKKFAENMINDHELTVLINHDNYIYNCFLDDTNNVIFELLRKPI